MQKTLTVNGETFTGKAIAKLFDKSNMTNGGDYIVTLNGQKYYGNYRQVQDDYFAPTCSLSNANAIALSADNGSYHWGTWITL